MNFYNDNITNANCNNNTTNNDNTDDNNDDNIHSIFLS